jgi:hypothetical protein
MAVHTDFVHTDIDLHRIGFVRMEVDYTEQNYNCFDYYNYFVPVDYQLLFRTENKRLHHQADENRNFYNMAFFISPYNKFNIQSVLLSSNRYSVPAIQ